MALSKLPLNSRAAVKKRFPTLAAVKSKVDDGGRARFKISRFNTLKNERINSFFAGVMAVHSSDVPSTTDCHSLVAMPASAGNRWLNNALTADLSGFAGESGIKRTNRPVRQVNKRVRGDLRCWAYSEHHQSQGRRIFESTRKRILRYH